MGAHNKAVIDGELQHVSPSQITTFERCARQWYFEKVAGLAPPFSDALNVGTKLHGQIDDYYENNTWPEDTRLHALLADPRLPPRGPGVLNEYPRDYALDLELGGVKVRGRIDLLDVRDRLRLNIIDFKTTSSFSYNKTPEELARNPQLVTYAHWAFKKFAGAEHAILTHAYILKKGAGYRFVDSDPLTPADIAPVVNRLESNVGAMQKAASTASALELPGNFSACDDYFGKECPYKAQCGRPARKGTSPPKPEKPDFYVPLPGETSTSMSTSISALRESQALPATTTSSTVPPLAPKGSESRTPPAEITATPQFSPTFDFTTPARGIVMAVNVTKVPQNEEPTSSPDKTLLLINCTPVKGVVGPVTLLDEEVERRSAEICKEYGAEDLRLKPLDFGKGTALLAASFRKNPIKGVVVARNSGLSATVLEVLRALPDVVVVEGAS